MMQTEGGDDYIWSIIKVDASNLSVEEDHTYGDSFVQPYSGPRRMKLFENNYLIVGGALHETSYDATVPRGVILSIDKSDLTSISPSSVILVKDWGNWEPIPYDLDIDETKKVLLSLITISTPTSVADGVVGRSGDGHHNEVLKHSISSVDGSLTYVSTFTWNEAYYDTCDTLNIAGEFFYISCGFWEADAADGTLPYVAKLNVDT